MDRTLLNDATSTDDSPTPGYMLNEIARATTANYQANVQLQEFLVSRLAHKNHNVKWKVLVIIKHVCRTGRAEFKREMARKVDLVKECTQFKGTPDPIRGDEYNRRVRDAAKEALDAIFDSQMPVTTSAVAAANRIQGMGNDYVPETKPQQSGGIISSLVTGIQQTILGDSTETTYVGSHGATSTLRDPKSMAAAMNRGDYTGPGGSSSGGSSMTGIGNPNFRDAREEKSWMQRAAEAASSAIGGSGSSTGAGSNGASGTSSYGSRTGEYTYATNRGSSAYGINDPSYNPRAGMNNAIGTNSSSNPAWQNGSSTFGTTTSTGAVTTVGKAGGATSDGAYERSLIDALCEPGGLKPVPPENKLQEFLVAAVTLSADIVGDCLADALQSDQWQTRIKALLVISSLVKAQNCQAHAEWWIEHANEVQALQTDGKASVRTQANKTLRAIGVDATAEDASSVRSVSPKPVAASTSGKTASLLDDFEDAAPTPSSFVPVSTAPAAVGNNLFADVAFTTAAPPAATPIALHVPAPATPIVHNANSLFDGLNVGGSGVGTVSGLSSVTLTPNLTPTVNGQKGFTTSVTAPPPPPSSDPFDFLEGAQSAPPPVVPAYSQPYAAPAPAPAAPPSIFDTFDTAPLPLLSAVPPAQPVAATSVPSSSAQPGGSSGFSFLGSSGPAVPAKDLISSVFAEPDRSTKSQEDDAFAQLNASLGLVKSAPNSNASSGRPVGTPMAATMSPMGASAGYGAPHIHRGGVISGYPAGAPAGAYVAPAGGAYGAPVGGVAGNAMAPSMLSYNAPRKTIPDAINPGPGGSSGFSFMGGVAPAAPAQRPTAGAKPGDESFDFVSQAMRNMNK